MSTHISNEFSQLDKVPCNTEVHLQILTASKPVRLRTHLIGIDSQKTIIIAFGTSSDWQSVMHFIKEGKGAVVRLVHKEENDANVFAFRSHISKLLNISGRWIVMDYPKQLQKAKLRHHSRTTVHLPACLQDKQGQQLAVGYLNDTSINGCAFIGSKIEHAQVGDVYQIKAKVNNNGETIAINATLMNMHEIDKANHLTQYGFTLNGEIEENKKNVKKIVFYHLEKESNDYANRK